MNIKQRLNQNCSFPPLYVKSPLNAKRKQFSDPQTTFSGK